MCSGRSQLKLFRLLSAASAVALLMLLPQTGVAAGRTGNVYVLTNQPTSNSVMVFHRDAAGILSFVGSFASGGVGAGNWARSPGFARPGGAERG